MTTKQTHVHFIVLIFLCSTKDYHAIDFTDIVSETVAPDNLTESEALKSISSKNDNSNEADSKESPTQRAESTQHPAEIEADSDTVAPDTTDSEALRKALEIIDSTSDSTKQLHDNTENEISKTTESEEIKKKIKDIYSGNANSLQSTTESGSPETTKRNIPVDEYLEAIKQGLKVAEIESENVSPEMSDKDAYLNSKQKTKKIFTPIETEGQPIVIVVVACETRLYQTLNLIKSALIFTQNELNFVIFTDEYFDDITEELLLWKANIHDTSFRFTVRNMGPLDINTAYLSEQFRKCGAQKLFLPSLLPTLDLILYVESDSVILGPLEELWGSFNQFDESQIAAMSRDPKVEATVMLMSLKRMREFGWPYIVEQILPQWKLRIYLCGHDIMNIIFNHHREAVMNIPCIYNYHTKMCESDDICPEAKSNRIMMLHSNRHGDSTVDDEDHVYKTIESHLRDFPIGVQEKQMFHYKLIPVLKTINDSACSSVMKPLMGEMHHLNPSHINTESRIVIAVIGCGNLRRPLGVIKSAIIFTKSPLYFVVFVQATYKKTLTKVLLNWKKLTYNNQIEFEVHTTNKTYSNTYKEMWMNKGKQCTIQKLFLHNILQYIDSLIYIDEDALFMGPVDDLWNMFKQFNKDTIAAMAKDHYIPEFAFFPFSKQTPYYKDLGLNSDVMLMNLTLMRHVGWENLVDLAYLRYNNSALILGDQSLINIVFNESSDKVTVLPCRFNFRSYLCDKDDHKVTICQDAIDFGVNVLLDEYYNVDSLYGKSFYMIYRAIDEFTIGEDTRMLPGVMKSYMMSKGPPGSSCGTYIKASVDILNQTLLYHKNLTPLH